MLFHFFYKKKYASLIVIICYIQCSSAYESQQHQHNLYTPSTSIIINNNYNSKNQHTTIYAESDIITIHYPKKIQLLGNVRVKYHNNVVISDSLTILNNNNHNISYTKLYAYNNVCYYNENIILTGSYAQFDLQNKNIDLHQGTYHLYKLHIYGTAMLILQRNNNFYTIMKKSNFTNCNFHNDSWNITGSEILYDWNKNNVHIWNAYLKIKTIPIFYSPYLSFPLNQNNILRFYTPTIKYNSTSGLTLKIPFPLFFSQYYSGNIIPYYTSNYGIGLQTKIHYSNTPSKGSITVNIVENNNKNNFHYNKILYALYWKHQTIINNTWHLDIDYTNHNNAINHKFKKNNKKYFSNINNDYINQKILCYYNNTHWKISMAYLSNANTYIKNTVQDNCIYSATPQLEICFFSSPMWKKRLYFQTFYQLSRFIPSIHSYPEAIRIHMEPNINLTINNYWNRTHIDARLKITHYQQKNIHIYNIIQHTQYPLQNKINRIIPQFKINRTILLQKKTNSIKSNKYFLESKLQYLYVPYTLQENIGIYDTKIIHTDYDNLFYNMQYSGLDRIRSANQVTGSITIRCFNKKSELFSLSAGQIINLDTNNNFINNIKNKSYDLYKPIINSHIELYTLGVGYWNISNRWNIHAEIQHKTLSKKLLYWNTILEYTGKNNQIFQSNYKYINTQYLQKNLTPIINNLDHYKTLSQVGIIAYYPIINNWIINYSYYYNIKSGFFIDQTIGIQYSTPCYIFGIIFERNMTDRYDKLHTPLYDSKIRFNFELIRFKTYYQLNPNKFLGSKMIPYQKLY